MSERNAAGLDRLREELEKLASGGGGEQSAGFLRSVLTNIPAFCCCMTPSGQLLYINRTVPGLTQDDVIGRTMFDFMPEGMTDDARAALERVVATGEPDRYVGFGPGKMGPKSRYDTWLGPIVVDGKVIALTLVTQDVSEEWEVQRRLRESEERLRMALDASGLGTWRYDTSEDKVEVDLRTQQIYRTAAGAAEPMEPDTTVQLEHPDSLHAEALRVMEHDARYEAEGQILRGDDSVGWVSVTGVPLRDSDGNTTGAMGTLLDVSERRALEAQVRQAQKLEAVGQLTAGIAHNFNNMLASIVPTLELVEGEVGPRNRQLVNLAQDAARRAAQMVRELLTFSGKRPPARDPVPVDEVLDRVLSICRTTFDRAIELESRCPPGLPFLLVDAPQIEQALMNILINARDAVLSDSIESPRVQIEVGLESPEPGGAQMMRVSITDNGPGMHAALCDRIFEPFFTTKDIGRGTGLGLSTTYGIVRDHGGALHCESEPGRGASFTMWLPTTDEPARATAELPRPEGVRDVGTVLIVDDEAVVRGAARRVLEDAGYEVREAADGGQALAELRDQSEVQLVVLDLNMPGPSWVEVLAAIRDRRPDVKVLAYTGELLARDVPGVDALLQKPADSSRLCAAVRDTLAAS